MSNEDKIFDDWDDEEFDETCNHFWVLHHTISGMGKDHHLYSGNTKTIYKCLMCNITKEK